MTHNTVFCDDLGNFKTRLTGIHNNPCNNSCVLVFSYHLSLAHFRNLTTTSEMTHILVMFKSINLQHSINTAKIKIQKTQNNLIIYQNLKKLCNMIICHVPKFKVFMAFGCNSESYQGRSTIMIYLDYSTQYSGILCRVGLWCQISYWRKSNYQEKTTNLPLVIDKL